MSASIHVPSNWYESFFTADVNRFWETMVPAEATAADLAFVTRHIGVAPPARLLDIPCGAGRHAIGLARLGYETTGVDLSEDAVARATAAGEGLPTRFVRADMRDFAAEDFEGALCLGNSIGYFGSDGMAAFFARLAANLRSGARLILDSYTCAESILPLQEDREIAFPGGSYRSRFDYDAMTSTLKTEAELTIEGESRTLLYAHQIVTSGALVEALARAGFETLSLYGDPEDGHYVVGGPRLLLVAVRN